MIHAPSDEPSLTADELRRSREQSDRLNKPTTPTAPLDWDDLLAQHYAELSRFATTIGGHSGPDYLHEALISARKAKPNGFAANEHPVAYMRSAIYSKLRDHWRRDRIRRMVTLDHDVSIYDPPEGDSQFDVINDRDMLRRKLSTLKPRQRMVLVSRAAFGLGWEEIATHVGKSVNTVRKDYQLACERLNVDPKGE